MTERPNAVFASLVGAAATLLLGVAGALAALGLSGVVALAATTVGAFTACVFFVGELGRVPLSAVVIIVLALASTAAFLRTLWHYDRERRLLRALPLELFGNQSLQETAAGVMLYVTPGEQPAAFCFGLRRPRVVVTSGLLDRLDADEQAAVIWHELEHARNHEPLKCLLARLAANSFFWIPVLRDLLDRFMLAKELVADRRAVAATSVRALAGALDEVSSAPSLAAVGAGDLAAARIERLFAPQTALPSLFHLRHALVSTLGGSALALTLAFPGQLDLREQSHMQTMLTSLSLHGLPGMAGGLLVNAAMLGAAILLFRRRVSRHVER